MKTKQSNIFDTLNPEVALALTALPGMPKDMREAVTPGSHKVDMTVRLCGTVVVGQDTLVRQVNRVHPWDIVCRLANKVSPQILDAVVRDAVEAAFRGEEIKDDACPVKQMAEAAIEAMGGASTIIRKGSVRFADCQIEVLNG